MELRHTGERPLVIGHRGAAGIAPENSLEGLEAAVAAGADLVEFDLGPGLILGHPGEELRAQPPTLDDALECLAAHTVGIEIDLKLSGIEAEVADAVRRHGLGARVVISSNWARSIRRFGREPEPLTCALSYPRDRHGVSRIAWPTRVTGASATALRSVMPARLPLLLAASGADALALHHSLVSAAVVDGTHRRGKALLAWTANEPAQIERLAQLRVDAIVSDDPGMALSVLGTLKSP